MKDDIQQAWSDSAKQLQQGMEENWARAMQSLQQMAQAAKPDPVGAGLPKIEFSPAKLQELQHTAFVLKEVDGQTTEEICKELAISSTNCWVLLYRARMSLRACLESGWFGKSQDAKPGKAKRR